MSEFYDQLETSDPEQRQTRLLQAIQLQLKLARQKVPAYQDIFADIASLSEFANLPLTRKSSLLELQKNDPPFGGYSAINAGRLTNIFASPGPIYEPGSDRSDFWRFARTIRGRYTPR